MTISKSFTLSSAPTCQNLDIQGSFSFSFFSSTWRDASASLDAVQNGTNVGGKKGLWHLIRLRAPLMCRSPTNSWNLLDETDFLRRRWTANFSRSALSAFVPIILLCVMIVERLIVESLPGYKIWIWPLFGWRVTPGPQPNDMVQGQVGSNEDVSSSIRISHLAAVNDRWLYSRHPKVNNACLSRGHTFSLHVFEGLITFLFAVFHCRFKVAVLKMSAHIHSFWKVKGWVYFPFSLL